MGFWKTIITGTKPKFWDKPNCRWKVNPSGDEAVIEFSESVPDQAELSADPDTAGITISDAEALFESWGNPAWSYPTPNELINIGYCTVADLRDRGITETAATEADLKRAIRISARVIDSFCNRSFFRRETRYALDGSGSQTIFLEDRPVIEILDLKVDGAELNTSEYKVYGDAGYVRLTGLAPIPGMNYEGIFPTGDQNVELHGLFGFSIIPAEVRESCVQLAIERLREFKSETDITKPDGKSTRNAIGIKSAKIEDISVEFEYPRYLTGKQSTMSTGNQKVDALLIKFKKDMDAIVV